MMLKGPWVGRAVRCSKVILNIHRKDYPFGLPRQESPWAPGVLKVRLD